MQSSLDEQQKLLPRKHTFILDSLELHYSLWVPESELLDLQLNHKIFSMDKLPLSYHMPHLEST